MVSERFDFNDPSAKYNSETNLTMASGNGRKNGGCYLSGPVGAILLLLAVLVAVGVGLIVHFAEDNDFTCNCGTVGSSGGGVSDAATEAVKQECLDLATAGHNEICSKCPSEDSGPSDGSEDETATTEPPKVVDVRLPDTLQPIHYDVELQPYFYSGNPEDFTYKGKVKILIKCLKATDRVTLQSALLVVDDSSIRFYGENGGPQDPLFLNSEYDEDRQFFILHLSKNMRVNEQYYVEMSYTSKLPDDLKGLYYSRYTRNEEPVYLVTTQFQPTDARRAFPCFDEPAIKAKFSITLVRSIDYISISNMPIINNDTRFEENGITFVKDVYQETPKMSTYLLAFIICDFQYTSDTVDNGRVLYRAWATPESVGSTQYALGVGTEVLAYFEEYFDIDYPLPKQDMIAIPDFAAGAMENWGLITYRETAMLYEEGVSNEFNKERVAIVVSHELAHQWFGDLVSPSWWDDLWLNEGFASFVEYMGVDKVEPEWNMFDQFAISDIQSSFSFDGLISSHPLYVPVGHPDEINEIFDTISYSKGATIIRMMRFFMGENSFKLALTNYLNNRSYDAAFHDDLWHAMTNQSAFEGKNLDVKSIMDTWTMQMNYPVVTISQDFQDPKKIYMHQERFLIDRNAEDPGKYTSDYNYHWTIPLTITTSKAPNFEQTSSDIIWMDKEQTTATYVLDAAHAPTTSDPNFWIIANVKQYGYYRVNYPEGNWLALTNQLMRDHTVIPVINRAQIINDAWNLAKGEYLGMPIALKTIEYLGFEREYVPWAAARSQISFVSSMIALSPIKGMFKRYMHNMVAPLYAEFGFDNTGSSHTQIKARVLIAGQACSYEVQECKDVTKNLYAQWMTNPETANIDVNLKGIVYCQGIYQGGWDEWKFALNMYNQSQVASEKALLLSALSCTDESWILNHYMNMIMEKDSIIRKQDALTVVNAVSGSVVGNMLAWNFFRSNYDTLRDLFGNSFFSWTNLISTITEDFNTEFQVQELTTFRDSKKGNLGSGERAFEQAIEKARTNVNWMTQNMPIITSWLNRQGYTM